MAQFTLKSKYRVFFSRSELYRAKIFNDFGNSLMAPREVFIYVYIYMNLWWFLPRVHEFNETTRLRLNLESIHASATSDIYFPTGDHILWPLVLNPR